LKKKKKKKVGKYIEDLLVAYIEFSFQGNDFQDPLNKDFFDYLTSIIFEIGLKTQQQVISFFIFISSKK